MGSASNAATISRRVVTLFRRAPEDLWISSIVHFLASQGEFKPDSESPKTTGAFQAAPHSGR